MSDNNNFAKVAIHRNIDGQVEQALSRVNQDFEGGRVSKTDLLSWLIGSGIERLNDSMIAEIRKAHFNQVAYLENLVKRLKNTQRSTLTEEDRALMKNLFENGTIKGRKRSKNKDSEQTQEKHEPSSP